MGFSKNTGVDCHVVLWRILPTQGSNLALLHCGQILCGLSCRDVPESNAFSSVLLDKEYQDQLAFMWEGRKCTSTVLAQGYLHTLLFVTGCWLETWRNGLSLALSLSALYWWHHVNPWRLTVSSQAAASPQGYLKARGWEVNADKVRGPGQLLKFLGMMCSGKTKVLPEVVFDKIQ